MRNLLFWLSRKTNYPFVAPQVVQISLTYRCNLKCKMCNIVNLLSKDEELSTGQVFRVIDEAKACGINELLLTGGEPFLREDIFDICRYSRERGLRSIVTTNGLLIDNDVADAIIDSKLDHIHFSIDGLEKTNDFFRGEGTFQKILESIRILNEKRGKGRIFSIGIACTVMEANVKELYEIVKLADGLNVDVINFQPLVNNNANFFDKNSSKFWLGKENVLSLSQELVKIRRYRPKHLVIYEEPHFELLVKYYKGELKKQDWICFGGFKTVFICFSKKEPLVYTCHGTCGNLDRVSLKEAWRSKEAYKLRLHSKNCQNRCMQSCYSRESAQNLRNLLSFYIRTTGSKHG